MYVTRTILQAAPVTGDAMTNRTPDVSLLVHKSMVHLTAWAVFNHMCLGMPTLFTPYFSVAHTDGSPLCDDEYALLYEVAGYKAYAERARELQPAYMRRTATLGSLRNGGYALNSQRHYVVPELTDGGQVIGRVRK